MTDKNASADMLRAKSAGGGRKRKKGASAVSMRWAAVFILGLAFFAVGVFGFVTSMQDGAIARGVRAGALELGGKSAAEAAEALRGRIASLTLTYSLEGTEARIAPLGGRGARPVVSYDVDGAIRGAIDVGRDVSAIRALAERLNAAAFGASVALPYSFDRVALRAALEEHFSDELAPAKNARFAVTFDADGVPTVKVVPGTEGTAVDFDAVMRETDARLRDFSDAVVAVPVKKDVPALTAADLEPLVGDVANAVRRAPLSLTAKGETWTASRKAVSEWIIAVPQNGKAALSLDRTKLDAFLSARATSIATEPKNAVFEEKDGKVTKFEPGVDGETLDVDGSSKAIAIALFNADAAEAAVNLPLTAVPPEITTEKSNPYGIKEIVGIGESNFAGSPKNRRHNIAVGAKSVHGTLIAPDAEFSLLKTLGAIDGTTGYLQELVIKGNETKPEYGGGLCQIGSTAFRGVLASGLPVTERRNHSYRVPYYERDGDGNYIGPGKDATIYDPAPDFKFKNDTGHHLLITSAISGNRLSFIFWGVNDGRKAEQTDARVYNIVKPPEKKIIETDDLAPGVEKCTEKPHVGSDAVFTYTVTYADGTKKVTDFKSHYRPWQEVCLVGRDPNAPVVPDNGMPADGGVPSQDASGAAGT